MKDEKEKGCRNGWQKLLEETGALPTAATKMKHREMKNAVRCQVKEKNVRYKKKNVVQAITDGFSHLVSTFACYIMERDAM